MKRIIETTLLCFLISGVAFGQVIDPKERAKQKAENRTNRKIDNAIDDGLDKIEGIFGFGKKKKKKKKKKEAEDQAQEESAVPNMGGLFGGGDATVQEVYHFKGQMDVEITYTEAKKGKSEAQQMRYLLPENDEDPVGFEIMEVDGKGGQDARVIMDWKNATMLTVLEEQKMISATTIDKAAVESSTSEAVEDQTDNFEGLRKTGRTKEILGYTCYEYEVDNEEAKGTMWVTEDIDLNPASMMGGMGKSMKQKQTLPNYPNGMYLEAHWEDKETGDTTDWKTTAIDLEKVSTVETAGYQVLNIGGKR